MSRDEDKQLIFDNYCSVLNGLDNKVVMQLFLNNVNVNKADLSEVVEIKGKTKV